MVTMLNRPKTKLERRNSRKLTKWRERLTGMRDLEGAGVRNALRRTTPAARDFLQIEEAPKRANEPSQKN